MFRLRGALPPSTILQVDGTSVQKHVAAAAIYQRLETTLESEGMEQNLRGKQRLWYRDDDESWIDKQGHVMAHMKVHESHHKIC
jgi:uncharacterized damage-inducible protein DinB